MLTQSYLWIKYSSIPNLLKHNFLRISSDTHTHTIKCKIIFFALHFIFHFFLLLCEDVILPRIHNILLQSVTEKTTSFFFVHAQPPISSLYCTSGDSAKKLDSYKFITRNTCRDCHHHSFHEKVFYRRKRIYEKKKCGSDMRTPGPA